VRSTRHIPALLTAALAAAVLVAVPGRGEEPGLPLGEVEGVVGAPEPSPAPSSARPVAAVAVRPLADPDPRLEKIVPTPAPPDSLTGYVWPLPRGRVTQPFGPSRWGSRIVNGEPFHDGIDLATSCGDRIVAAHDGVVLAAGRRYDGYMGWRGDLAPYTARLDEKALWRTLPIVVVVDDGNGYRSVYAHFNRIVVERGQRVEAGQLLGYEGATGRATGCHLHYELFSPLEPRAFALDPDVAARMLLPTHHTARIDPLLVLPPRLAPGATPTPLRGRL
jgi:murein DD-endopeptidase MepM/ murein hydrolase activator NlpD